MKITFDRSLPKFSRQRLSRLPGNIANVLRTGGRISFKLLLQELRTIEPKSPKGQDVLTQLCEIITSPTRSEQEDHNTLMIINALRQASWIKCYYRAISEQEEQTLFENRGRSMTLFERANFSSTPNHPILGLWANEDGYTGEVIMIPALPDRLTFYTDAPRDRHEGLWPRLQQHKDIPSHNVWFMQYNEPPLSAQAFYDKYAPVRRPKKV